MPADARVCPFCGEPPGHGIFCAHCGRNLADVAQLPTRDAWEHRSPATDPAPDPAPVASVDAFLVAMREAGEPGLVRLPESRPGFLGRQRHAHGWVARQTRDDPDPSGGPAHGVFLTQEGRLRRLETSTRGVGQRAAPRRIAIVGPELDAAERDDPSLLVDLASLAAAHGVRVP